MATKSDEREGTGGGTETLRHTRSRRGLWVVVAVVAVAAVVVAYVVASGILSPGPQTLNGAGATFPAPLITLWTQKYVNVTGVKVNYQAVGSGTGITDLQNKIVDFAASDAPLSAKDRAANPNLAMGAVLHIPETIGAVTFAYNLPGFGTGLNLTGPILAQIFLGRITKWNDANLTRLNPRLATVDQNITVVHRSDSSGTSFVWTSYLHASDPANWTSGLVGKQPNWPTGIGQSGNSGVAGYISKAANTYSCGYVELAYVIQNHMTVAGIENPDHAFIVPSLANTTAAAGNATVPSAGGTGDWANVSILNAPGATSYPVATFTYFLVYKELSTLGSAETQAKAQALVNFLWWVVHDGPGQGQTYSASLSYVPLPRSVVTIDEASINSLTFNGQALVHS